MRALLISVVITFVFGVIFGVVGVVAGLAGAGFTAASVLWIGIPLLLFGGCFIALSAFCFLSIPALFLYTVLYPPPPNT